MQTFRTSYLCTRCSRKCPASPLLVCSTVYESMIQCFATFSACGEICNVGCRVTLADVKKLLRVCAASLLLSKTEIHSSACSEVCHPLIYPSFRKDFCKIAVLCWSIDPLGLLFRSYLHWTVPVHGLHKNIKYIISNVS